MIEHPVYHESVSRHFESLLIIIIINNIVKNYDRSWQYWNIGQTEFLFKQLKNRAL